MIAIVGIENQASGMRIGDYLTKGIAARKSSTCPGYAEVDVLLSDHPYKPDFIMTTFPLIDQIGTHAFKKTVYCHVAIGLQALGA